MRDCGDCPHNQFSIFAVLATVFVTIMALLSIEPFSFKLVFGISVMGAAVLGMPLIAARFKTIFKSYADPGNWIDDAKQEGKKLLIFANPITIVPTILGALTYLIWLTKKDIARFFVRLPNRIVRAIFAIFKVLVSFLWKLFKLIHSDVRVLCLIDGAIGGVIGYLFGQPLIGAVFGAAFGMLNYRVVSIWWLKLKPKHS